MSVRLSTALLVLLLAPATGLAQNREHLQMTADLRILQEHVSRLQLTVNRLETELATTNQRLEDASGASVKGFADQQLLINQLTSTLTSVRERIDDNSVRVSQLGQEFAAVREGLRLLTVQINTLVTLLQPTLPEGEDPTALLTPVPPGSTADTPPRSADPAAPSSTLDPVILPQPASAVYQAALGDYLAGRYDSAIEGFREVVNTYPDSTGAAGAQFQIAQSYNLKKDCRSAVPEYRRFVQNYPTAEDRDEGLYMLGFCYNDVGQRDDARQMYQQLTTEYPDSTWAIMARQRLEAMGVQAP